MAKIRIDRDTLNQTIRKMLSESISEGNSEGNDYFPIEISGLDVVDDYKLLNSIVSQPQFKKSRVFADSFSDGNKFTFSIHNNEIPMLISALQDMDTRESIGWANDINSVLKYEEDEESREVSRDL